jgi:hypothetical protein
MHMYDVHVHVACACSVHLPYAVRNKARVWVGLVSRRDTRILTGTNRSFKSATY